MTPEQLKSLMADHDELRGNRYYWEGHWQDIRELVRPAGEEIRKVTTPGRVKNQFTYDSTAADSCVELAGGLQSFLMSPGQRWFDLAIAGEPEISQDFETVAWLQETADAIYAQFQSPVTQFNLAVSEAMIDICSYGTTAVAEEWNSKEGMCLFRTSPLRDCWIRENSDAKVDSLHRSFRMTIRQLVQQFGEDAIPEKVRQNPQNPASLNREWEVIHIVRPRTDRNIRSFTKTNMPFASFWILRDTGDLLLESGFREFPFMVPRWLKLSDETYGRSPAMLTLPDIKMLNAMAKTFIKVSQKIADPPLVLPNDGFMLPINTHPGSMIFKEPGSEPIEQLPSGERNLPITWEVLKGQQEKVRQGFFIDFLRLGKENKEMTATEVQDRRDEKLRFLAPMLGRQESEFLGPVIKRTYNLLRWHDKIREAPPSMQGKTLRVEYVSPAAKAQQGIKGINMGRYIQEILPLAEVSPGVMDTIDFDAYAQELAVLRNVDRTILRDPEEIATIRDERKEMEQAQQMAQLAEPASKAMKNIAEAQTA